MIDKLKGKLFKTSEIDGILKKELGNVKIVKNTKELKNDYLVPTRRSKIRNVKKFGIELETGVRDRSNSDFSMLVDAGEKEVEKAVYSIEGTEYPKKIVRNIETIKEYTAEVVRLDQTSDGSVSTSMCSVEFVSPILSGPTGEDFIKKTVKSIRKNGVTVNSTCGMHVHVDTSEYDPESQDYQKLFGLYFAFENILFSLVPKTRKTNRYCQPWRNFNMHEDVNVTSFTNTKNLHEFAQIFFDDSNSDFDELLEEHCDGKYNSIRYYALNFYCLLRSIRNGETPHVEFRHHSGTMNERKILEWVNLCTQLVAIAPTLKMEKINELINGCTIDDMFKVLKINKASRTYLLKRAAKFADSEVLTEGEE